MINIQVNINLTSWNHKCDVIIKAQPKALLSSPFQTRHVLDIQP